MCFSSNIFNFGWGLVVEQHAMDHFQPESNEGYENNDI